VNGWVEQLLAPSSLLYGLTFLSLLTAGYLLLLRQRRTSRARLDHDAFKSTLDLTLDAVFFFDAESLRFTYVNQGAVDQLGYSREQLLGMHPYDIKPEYPELRFRELIAPLLDGAQQSLRFETLHRTRYQGDIPVEIFLQYITPAGERPRFVAITYDISLRKHAKENLMQALDQLSASEQRQTELLLLTQREQGRLTALLSAMDIGILFADQQGQVEYLNPAFRRMWAIAEEIDLIGRPAGEVLHHSVHRLEAAEQTSRQLLDAEDDEVAGERLEMELVDGRILTQASYPVSAADGHAIGRLWIFEDITHERQTAAQLVFLAEHDPLTGLHNRHRFQEDLERMISNARRSGVGFALLYFDLDGFKHINDNFGHRTGDAVLVRTTDEVAGLVRSGEMFARLGGDEFVILSLLSTEEAAARLAARISGAISTIPFEFQGTQVQITASIGIALFPRDGDSADELVAHADAAMYQAKQQGKNTWAAYRAG
jgi:diguanylate cyclase (GGDEF)-like protein/PAS domain S-box-containing protein